MSTPKPVLPIAVPVWQQQAKTIAALADEGLHQAEIARRMGKSGALVARVAKRAGIRIVTANDNQQKQQQERTERLRELAEKGLYIAEAAREMGISERSARRLCEKAGITLAGAMSPGRKRNEAREAVYRELHRQGLGAAEIAARLNVGMSHVRDRLRELKLVAPVERRPAPTFVTVWPEAAVGGLRELWERHVPCLEIARTLSRDHGAVFTKNAIIGKAKRLGLAPHAKARNRGGAGDPPAAQRIRPQVIPAKPRRMESPPVAMALPAPVEMPATPFANPVPFLTRTSRQCCWPSADRPGPAMLVCGEPVAGEGKPYCRTHALRAVGRGTPGERAAHEVGRAA